jgi:nitrite reductase/ring-hydroxylating ferredoxin subunit
MAEPRVPVSGRRTLLAGAGTIVACTHQGYIVASVSGGTINCPCHGSKFSIANGSVVNGRVHAGPGQHQGSGHFNSPGVILRGVPT